VGIIHWRATALYGDARAVLDPAIKPAPRRRDGRGGAPRRGPLAAVRALRRHLARPVVGTVLVLRSPRSHPRRGADLRRL